MIAPLLAALLFAPAQTPPPATPAAHRVLVLDLEAIGVEAKDAAAATRVVVGAAADVAKNGEGAEVVSSADLRRLAALEADKSAAGCADDESCLADIAGALGAEKVLFGSLSQLGTTVTASLSLYTAQTGRVDRRSVDVNDLSALPGALRQLTTSLLSGDITSTAPRPDPETPSASPWFGVVVGGGVAGVVGAGTAVVSEVLLQDAARDGDEKAAARIAGFVGVGVAAVGVAAAAAGAVLGGLE